MRFATIVFLFSSFALSETCPKPNQQFKYFTKKLRAEKTGKEAGLIRLFYGIEGNFDPNKPTLVFLKGGPGGYQKPEKIKNISPANMNIIHPHHRGVGCTKILSQESTIQYPHETGLLGLERAAEDLNEIRKHLLGKNGKWYIYGVSYGSMLAQRYAIRYPNYTKGIILDSSFHKNTFVHFASKKFEKTFLTSNLRVLIDKIQKKYPPRTYPNFHLNLMRKLFIGTYSFRSRNYLDKLLTKVLNAPTFDKAKEPLFLLPIIPTGLTIRTGCEEIWDHRPKSNASYYMWYFRYSCRNFASVKSGFDHTKELKALKVPTVIMGGKFDPVTPIEAMREMNNIIPNSVLLENKYVGHSIQDELPKCWKKVLTTFLKTADLKKVAKVGNLAICKNSPKVPLLGDEFNFKKPPVLF